MLQSRRWWWWWWRRLEVQPPRWEAGAAGAGKGALGAGARRGLLRPPARRGEWERARLEHAGALLRLALGRRAAREQPATRSPRPAQSPGRPRPAVGSSGSAASAGRRPGRALAAAAAAGRPWGRPERALPPAATRSRRWLGRRAPQAARARPRPRRERAPGRSSLEAAAAAGTDGVAGRSWAAAQRQPRRGRRQGAPPARMLRFLRRTFGRRSMQRYARGAAGRGAAGLGDERDGGPRGGPAAASTLPAAPGGSVFPPGGGPLLTGGAAVHISAAGSAKATLYCRVFLLDGTEVSVDLPVSDGRVRGTGTPRPRGSSPLPLLPFGALPLPPRALPSPGSVSGHPAPASPGAPSLARPLLGTGL